MNIVDANLWMSIVDEVLFAGAITLFGRICCYLPISTCERKCVWKLRRRNSQPEESRDVTFLQKEP